MKMIVRYPFRDKETGTHYRPGQELEVTKARANALAKARVAVAVKDDKPEGDQPEPKQPKGKDKK